MDRSTRHNRPQERRSGRLAASLHNGFEKGPVDVLGIDVPTLVVAELGGEEGELAAGPATDERLVGDDHEPVDVAVSEAVPLGQRTRHHHGQHLVVVGGGLRPTFNGHYRSALTPRLPPMTPVPRRNLPARLR
jgi:hypothetical protein